MDEIESICQNEQIALDIIKEKINCLNAKNEFKEPQSMNSTEIGISDVSESQNQMEQDTSSINTKQERCLKKEMEYIHFQMVKKHKSASFLDVIYSMIDVSMTLEI
jgi:hypothetical protein